MSEIRISNDCITYNNSKILFICVTNNISTKILVLCNNTNVIFGICHAKHLHTFVQLPVLIIILKGQIYHLQAPLSTQY